MRETLCKPRKSFHFLCMVWDVILIIDTRKANSQFSMRDIIRVMYKSRRKELANELYIHTSMLSVCRSCRDQWVVLGHWEHHH